jgi:hypothetical protein
LWNSWCEKFSLFPNVTNREEPTIHRTKQNYTHVENHREFKLVVGETADIRQYYTTTETWTKQVNVSLHFATSSTVEPVHRDHTTCCVNDNTQCYHVTMTWRCVSR